MESTAIAAIFTIAPTWSQIKPERLHLYPLTISPPKLLKARTAPLFLIHCSTKPDTDRPENVSAAQPSSNSRIQENEVSGTVRGIPSNSLNSRGLVFGLGLQDSWDSAEIGSPVVKRYLSDEGERWYLWYHGRSEGKMEDSIGLAVSCNGIHWERGAGKVNSSNDVGLTMASSTDWWAFDTQGVKPCEVVMMSSAKVRANNSLYWLYYSGSNGEKADSSSSSENSDLKADFKSLPGLAMSQDGRHWARIEGEHHSGALFDVGSEGEWDSLFIGSPQVVYHGSGDMRMYYHSYDQENDLFVVGIARSRDGINWIKLGKMMIMEGSRKGMFDELGMLNACVVKDRKDGWYVMAYEGVDGNGRRSIGMATSSDGLKGWKRVGEGALLGRCGEGGWDCEGVGSPCLVQMDGNGEEWRLYYSGFDREGKTGIGLALSQQTGFGKFERWGVSMPLLST